MIEVTILEQTHKGRNFVPNSKWFTHENFTIGSNHSPRTWRTWGSPFKTGVDHAELLGGLKCSFRYYSHRLRFRSPEEYARFKAVVLAYNEKFN